MRVFWIFFFQAEDGIRDAQESRGLGDVYKRQWFIHLRFPGHEHVKIIDGVPEGWGNLCLPAVIDLSLIHI